VVWLKQGAGTTPVENAVDKTIEFEVKSAGIKKRPDQVKVGAF